MNRVRKALNKIYKQSPTPMGKGFNKASNGIDILVWDYAAGVVGITTSYLAGKQIDVSRIKLGENLDQQLDECMEKLKELIAYKKKHDVLARMLIDELKHDSSD